MTTTLQQLSPAQANQEARINELMESLSAAGLFSRRHAVTTGLTWGYYGGRYNGNTIADGTVALTNAATNYVVVARATGVVSVATTTTNWLDATNYARLYQLTTAGSVVTAIVDERFGTGGLLNGGGSAASSGGLRGLIFTSDTDSTADSDPGNGLFKWNNATQASATVLYFDNQTLDAVSLTTFWASLSSTGFIYLQQSDDQTKWQLWKWTATPVDGTGYRKFTCALQANGGSIADNKTVLCDFMPAGGGGGLTLPYAGNATSVADPQFDLYSDGGSTQPGYSATTYSAANALNGGTFHCRAARGTLAAPTALQAGDLIGGYGARWCHTAGNFHTSSPVSIHPQVTENQSASAWGSWWRLLTTPKGSTVRQERGGITDNGTFWSHDTATYDATLNRQTLPVADARFVASGESTVLTGASYVAVHYGGGGGSSPGFRGVGTGGTAASPSATLNGFTLAFMGGHGHDGTNITTSTKALLTFAASENWSGSAQGTQITMAVTRNGTTTRTTHYTLGNEGLHTLAAPTVSAQTLLVTPFNGATLNQLALDGPNSGFRTSLMVRNTSDTASSDARQLVVCGGASAGDAYTEWSVSGIKSWVAGVDNSDSDAWVLSEGSALGTTNRLKIAAGGNATFSGSITHGSTTLLATSVALTDGAGAATGTLANAPAAGNPTKWIPINDNGTTRYVPAW